MAEPVMQLRAFIQVVQRFDACTQLCQRDHAGEQIVQRQTTDEGDNARMLPRLAQF